MTKAEFLSQLNEKLSALPDTDIDERICFYSEMIDDRIEDGYSEEDAVAMLGSIDEIAEQIIGSTPLTKFVRKKVSAHRRLGALEIILLILGSPIWLSLLITAVSVAFSIYVSLWSIVIALWSAQVSLAVCGLGGLIAGGVYAVAHSVIPGFAVLGAALVCVGLAIFAFYCCKLATRGIIWLTKKMWLGVKLSFVRKEKN